MVKKNDMDEFPRMTSRLLELEAAKKAKQQQQQETSNVAQSRKVPKMRRLDEVKDTKFGSTSQQGEGTVNHEALPYEKANLPSESQIPDNKVLEFILDTLQRKDRRGYFAEPIDGDEVEEYYDYITEPMDFGTMRAKFHEGNYVTLKQFQDDVYLICNNAMSFNSSSTIYYREARAIHELAERIFSTLKDNPEEIYNEFSKKRRSSRKTSGEAETSGAKDNKKAKGKRPAHKRSKFENQTRANFNEEGWRHTYQRPTSYEETDVCSLKQLVFRSLMGISINVDWINKRKGDAIQKCGYEDSLRRFVKNLGPVAQKVAKEKLMSLNQMQSCSLLGPSRNEIEEYVDYNNNVMENTITLPPIPSSDPGQTGKMAETSSLSRLISDMPSFVGPISSVLPSTMVQESSLGLFGNMFQQSYAEMSHQESYDFSRLPNQSSFSQASQQQRYDYLAMSPQPPDESGIQQYSFSQSQSQPRSQDHDLHPGMMNPKI